MAIQDEAALILQLYDLRREETMRKARDWYAREFNPESMADLEKELAGEHSGHLRMVTSYWEMAQPSLTTARSICNCSTTQTESSIWFLERSSLSSTRFEAPMGRST